MAFCCPSSTQQLEEFLWRLFGSTAANRPLQLIYPSAETPVLTALKTKMSPGHLTKLMIELSTNPLPFSSHYVHAHANILFHLNSFPHLHLSHIFFLGGTCPRESSLSCSGLCLGVLVPSLENFTVLCSENLNGEWNQPTIKWDGSYFCPWGHQLPKSTPSLTSQLYKLRVLALRPSSPG